MNADRRKRLQAVIDQINAAASILESAKGDLEDIKGEEQEAFDNMPESFQQGERGQASESAIDNMDTALDGLPDLDDVVSNIESAME